MYVCIYCDHFVLKLSLRDFEFTFARVETYIINVIDYELLETIIFQNRTTHNLYNSSAALYPRVPNFETAIS